MAREIRDEKFHFHLELVVKKIYIPSVADLHLCRVPIEPKYVSCVAFALIAAAAAAVAIHSVVPAAFNNYILPHTHTINYTLTSVVSIAFLLNFVFRFFFGYIFVDVSCFLLASCALQVEVRVDYRDDWRFTFDSCDVDLQQAHDRPLWVHALHQCSTFTHKHTQ